MRTKRGTILIAMGLLLIAAALSLTVYNLLDDNRAKRSSEKIVAVIEAEEERSESGSAKDKDRNEIGATDDLPLFERYPEMEMPVKEIEGHGYIGVLEFPGLDRTLPVMEEWSYPNLKISPCRFSGSAYNGSLVIAGHNYGSHFSPIKNMSVGDEVIFTDADGNSFFYEVSFTEILQPTAVEEMESGDWDLTLFTCTYGGKTRFALRCTQVGTKPAGEGDR